MYSPLLGRGGWVGAVCTFWYECSLVVLACETENLHVCIVCIWCCEHARFRVEVFYALYINFHSFILWPWGSTTLSSVCIHIYA